MQLRNLGFDHIAVNHSIGFATTNNSIGYTNGNELFNTNMIEEFLWRHKHSNHWTSLLQGLASTEFSTSNNNHYTKDIINNLPTRVLGDYSQYEYQEDNQLVEFVDLPDTYSSDSDSSTESESDNHSEFTPPPAQRRRTN
ncbi:hypothetical protein INT45_009768 [Circinella minor]|uniref:Uncharacterized protein n=1 Tax=Circinella minor TaxID=1195481 RepID=A0A8H7V4Y8_9FUNG|nr:hypothetical protein INT45_009768 [Circinella minor]